MWPLSLALIIKQDAVLSQGEPRDAAISFNTMATISLAQHGFLA